LWGSGVRSGEICVNGGIAKCNRIKQGSNGGESKKRVSLRRWVPQLPLEGRTYGKERSGQSCWLGDYKRKSLEMDHRTRRKRGGANIKGG